MKRLLQFVGVFLELGFHAFIALYWYLVNGLYPEYALIGGVATYAACRFFRSRVVVPGSPLLLMALSGLAFFLMLNSLPGLRGFSQLLWLSCSAIFFRLSFSQLMTMRYRAGALFLSYVLFLVLPLGFPRLWSGSPDVQDGNPLDVVVVGAGFGGIAMGKELLDSGITNFQIYEAAPEVGGTWWHNRYPGLHVDVQSALYSYSFYPNPGWSKRWAPRNELLDYSIRSSQALGVRPFIKFNTRVQSVAFDEESGLWNIDLNEKSVTARHLVLATGGLHIPKTPQFAGADSYTGIVFHAARWRDDVTLTGKRVAVVGSGASAVQIVPEIAKLASHVDIYQRTPNWVAPQDNRAVSAARQHVYRYIPLAYKLQRLRTHIFSELGFRLIFPLESERRGEVEEALKRYIGNTVNDADLVKKLTPNYEFGCKRPLVTGSFYPSLNRPNVGLVTEGIAALSPSGIRSSTGVEREYDVIIMATGYRVAELPFPIAGRSGQSLMSQWQDQPEAYESMMVHGFPNFYLMSGPNSGVFGSIIIHIESAANYMMQVIEKAGDSTLIEPTLAAQQAYSQSLQQGLQKTVWAGSCKSWYKLDNGYVIANNPLPISQILFDRARPDWDHFEFAESP